MQSAYRPYHSTETALHHTPNDVYQSADHGEPTLLVSLDLSAAFDTIDHSSLLSRLNTSFGFSDTALSWLASYLSGRSQAVRIGSMSSPTTNCVLGVPQGSVLGPILFTIFVSPVGDLASSYQVRHQQYADDTQLYISLSPHQPQHGSAACIHSMLGFLITVSRSIRPNLTLFFSLLVNDSSHLCLFHTSSSLALRSSCPILLPL
jgi:Reverse transcriptase (RNA-dependent DNA polymerase)